MRGGGETLVAAQVVQVAWCCISGGMSAETVRALHGAVGRGTTGQRSEDDAVPTDTGALGGVRRECGVSATAAGARLLPGFEGKLEVALHRR